MAQDKHEVLPGTLNLLVLKTLGTMGPLHGYGIARRIEQISGDLLELNQGTIYPALLKLEQLGWIRTRWSVSENNRRAKFYSLTRGGKAMNRLRIFLSRLRDLFLKRNLEQELADEIQSHLEMQIEDYERQGMNPDEARYAALRKFGGVDQVKENYRERRGLPFVETFLRDLSYGARMLRRSPIVTSVAILSLALGIGANTALFSVVDAVLLKTLPVEAPDRLVVLEWQAGRAFRTSGMSGTSNVDVPPGMRGLSLFRYEVFERMRQARVAGGSESPLSDLF